jgi:hypothetical protein
MTGLWREMRPYLTLWRPLLHLARGTWALLRRAGETCLEGVGSDKLWRLLTLVVALGIAGRIAERTPMVMLPVTVTWLVAAWRAGPPLAAVQKAEDAEPDGPPTLPRPTHDEVATAMNKLADPHIHLVPVAAALHTTTGVVREVLAEMGVPIADGVRMRGRNVSPGVRKTDLPPLPAPSEFTSVVDVVAGQTSNNNGSNVLVSRTQEGLWIIQDPEHSRHYHVTKSVGSADTP